MTPEGNFKTNLTKSSSMPGRSKNSATGPRLQLVIGNLDAEMGPVECSLRRTNDSEHEWLGSSCWDDYRNAVGTKLNIQLSTLLPSSPNTNISIRRTKKKNVCCR